MGMGRRALLGAGLAVLMLAGCDELTVPADDRWEAVLTGFDASALHGGAVALSARGRTVVTARIVQAAPGGSHPWHIHAGSCDSGGSIMGDATAYPPLQVGAAGMAEAWTTLDHGLNPDQAYHVNVHLSAAELSTIVACGDLVLR